MILISTQDLKKYISVASNFTFATLEPYITKAINSYTKKYVGNLHVFLKDQSAESEENATIKNEAREHLRSAIANFAYFMFTPYASITMDSSGMSNVQNEKQSPLQNGQMLSIQRELLRSGHESMDLLLEVLEKNINLFTEYAETFQPLNSVLMVKNSTEFQKCYNINNSRQTYLALVPALSFIEDKYIKTLFSSEFITLIKTDANPVIKEINQYIKKAIVAFTISKVYDEGIFNLDASGIKLKFDMLPFEKAQSVDYGRPSDQLKNSVKKQLENGTQYILIVKQLITENASSFSAIPKIYKKDSPKIYQAHNTSGIVGLL
jgi:hypothetical protein